MELRETAHVSSNNTPYADLRDDDIVQVGKRFGYGNWLQPIINANDQCRTETHVPMDDQVETTQPSRRRGRGRPRVTKLRDESAVEKRRAQVREAQRTYQKRKDHATASDKKRVDELLQVISDLSSDVESLLHAASKAGAMYRDDSMSKQIQRLWSSYDSAINHACVKPELRLLQLKNDRRLADHHSAENFRIEAASSDASNVEGNANPQPPAIRQEPTPLFDPTSVSFELVRFEETTVMQPFQRTSSVNSRMAGRSIFDIVKERQAAMKKADKAALGQ